MIGDRELWACALAIERRYQTQANAHAAARINALLAAGDLAGVAVWRRIADALLQLRADQVVTKPT